MKEELQQKEKTCSEHTETHEQDRQKWAKEKTELSDKCCDLEYRLVTKVQDFSRQRERITMLEKQVKTLHGQIQIEQEENDAIKKDESIVEDLQKKVSDVEAQVNNLRDIIMDKHDAERDLKNIVDATKNAVDDLKVMAISTNNESHELKVEVGELKSSINQMMAETQAVRSELGTMKTQLTTDNQALRSEVGTIHTQLTNINANIERAVQKRENNPVTNRRTTRGRWRNVFNN